MDKLKRVDQIALLKVACKHTDTGIFEGLFTYPGCGPDLVKQGLATEDAKITMAGRAALWLLGEGDDPTDTKSFVSFNISIPTKGETE